MKENQYFAFPRPPTYPPSVTGNLHSPARKPMFLLPMHRHNLFGLHLFLAKICIFPQENQYFASPRPPRYILMSLKMYISLQENRCFCFQCIDTISLASTCALQRYTPSCKKVLILRPKATSRPSSVSNKYTLLGAILVFP